MRYTVSSLKVAETLDEMPDIPNAGFGIYLDKENPNDGENMNASDKSNPLPEGKFNKNQYIKKPNDPVKQDADQKIDIQKLDQQDTDSMDDHPSYPLNKLMKLNSKLEKGLEALLAERSNSTVNREDEIIETDSDERIAQQYKMFQRPNWSQ